jgi:hypothetical protein
MGADEAFRRGDVPPAIDARDGETRCPACQTGKTVVRVTLDRKCVACGRYVSDKPQPEPAPQKPLMVDGWPRRNRIDLYSPAERVIAEARTFVDHGPADVRLTEAVILLGKAMDKVSDYVDEHGWPAAEGPRDVPPAFGPFDGSPAGAGPTATTPICIHCGYDEASHYEGLSQWCRAGSGVDGSVFTPTPAGDGTTTPEPRTRVCEFCEKTLTIYSIHDPRIHTVPAQLHGVGYCIPAPPSGETGAPWTCRQCSDGSVHPWSRPHCPACRARRPLSPPSGETPAVEPHVAAINASIECSLSHARAHVASVFKVRAPSGETGEPEPLTAADRAEIIGWLREIPEHDRPSSLPNVVRLRRYEATVAALESRLLAAEREREAVIAALRVMLHRGRQGQHEGVHPNVLDRWIDEALRAALAPHPEDRPDAR